MTIWAVPLVIGNYIKNVEFPVETCKLLSGWTGYKML